MWYVCLYICIHASIYVCVYVCMCVHSRCAQVSVYMCEHTCAMWTFPGIWHPIWSKSILLSWQVVFNMGGCFCWKFCGLTPFLQGAWHAQPRFFLNMRDSRRSKGRQTQGQKTLLPPKAIRWPSGEAKLQETLKNWEESCPSKYAWLAVLLTRKFSQSTWGDFV